MLDLEKMKSAAMAANTRDHNENPDWYSEDDLLGFAYYPKNARFISAVSPSAVLELIERLEKAEKQRDELLSDVERCYKMLLSEPDTKGALFKAENILREAIASTKESK